MDKLSLQRAMKRRVLIRNEAESSYKKCKQVLATCKNDPIAFIRDWVWLCEPRNAGSDLPVAIPFDLWEFQEEFLVWLQNRFQNTEDGVVEKSRDMGASWVVLAFLLWCWLFIPHFRGGLGSRKEDLVDRKDDPDALFEKLRFMLSWLPGWMVPIGFDPRKHDKKMLLVNPENHSTITGEAGGNIGRGGRTAFYLVDEAAYLENAFDIDAALSHNSRCVIWLSTVSMEGKRSMFAQKRFSGDYEVLTLHWTKHPFRDQEWYDKQQRKFAYNRMVVKREIDIDYEDVGEQVMIPSAWVQAAINANLRNNGTRVSGLDVADSGEAENALCFRDGPNCLQLLTWASQTVTQTAARAKELNIRRRMNKLNYDRIGVGAGISVIEELEEEDLPFELCGINVGDKPTLNEYPDDPDRVARMRFLNLRAELWWALRLRFQATYERFVEGNKNIPDEDCISIPHDALLITQLSAPRFTYTTNGKIQLESKKSMKARKIPSPDRADALVLAFAPFEQNPIFISRA